MFFTSLDFEMIKENIVAAIKSKNMEYPNSPFNPPSIFPEFKDFKQYNLQTDISNDIYHSVRELLHDLELDKENFGTSHRNPLWNMIQPGQHVVIKPNLVFHEHPLGDKEWVLSMISHASIIRPIIDYILLAAWGEAKITICDVPIQSANWEKMIEINGLVDLIDFYKKKSVHINLLDLRFEIWIANKENLIIERNYKERDPLWYSVVDLWHKSALMPIIKYYNKFEITDYWSWTVPKHHNKEKNEYFVPNTILDADLFINLPKLKTHRKAGITFAMKNLIWINWDKSWLAHHRRGSKSSWWDEYDRFHIFTWLKSNGVSYLKKSKIWIQIARVLYRAYKYIILKWKEPKAVYMQWNPTHISEWSWYGNDTIRRCIKDLNNIIFFADKKWVLHDKPQRKYLCIGDGILAWDKEWPMEQTPKKAGIILWWFNPVYIDRVAASIMGFDYKKIPQIVESFKNEYFNLCNHPEKDITWRGNIPDIKNINLRFIPSANWRNHIEI